MNPRDRRIRQLHFRCHHEEHARRGQTLLADALRTASLEDDGRVLIIRSLALGRLSPHASSMEWSRRVEQCVRGVRSAAVWAGTPGAANADAVWFPNAIELWVALALRAARNAPCPEWFWPPAAPGWSPRLDATGTLRLTFKRLQEIGGWHATFALAHRLMDEGRLLPLLRALTPSDVEPWRWREAPEPAATPAAPAPPIPGEAQNPPPSPGPTWPPAWSAVAGQFLAEAPAAEGLLVWLAAAALSAGSLTPPRIPEARRLATQMLESKPAGTPGDGDRGVRIDVASTGGREIPALNEIPKESEPPVVRAQTPHAEGEATACGGLFFLIALFERLGIAEWPDAGPSGWEALSLILQRCQPQPEDALVRCLPAKQNPELKPAAFALRAWPRVESLRGTRRLVRWRAQWRILLDGTGRLPLAAWPRGARSVSLPAGDPRPVRSPTAFPPGLDPRTVALSLGAHRLSRRTTGLGVKALVRRPARVRITGTHIDLFFRPDQADARIRRAALDLDPGWVPWLGRVVSFHYTHER